MVELTIIGRLGADAELATSRDGKNYVRFNVAVDETAKGEKTTSWFRCMYWYNGSEPPKVFTFLKKGTPVFVRGRESVSLYTGREGSTHIDRSVFIQNLQLLPSRTQDDGLNEQQSKKTDPSSLSTGSFTPQAATVQPTATAQEAAQIAFAQTVLQSPTTPQQTAASTAVPKVETYDEMMRDLPF